MVRRQAWDHRNADANELSSEMTSHDHGLRDLERPRDLIQRKRSVLDALGRGGPCRVST